MKRTLTLGLALLCLPLTSMANHTPDHKTLLNTEEQKLSYTIGVDLGSNLRRQNIKINADILSQGVHDGLTANKPQLSSEQMESVLQKLQKTLMAKQVKQFKKAANHNQTDGEKFLETNKAKPNVLTTTSGLQYRVINAGKGAKPLATDTVSVKYTGRLVSGKVFDTTDRTGRPVSFRVTDVIPGWTEALKMMREGATWEIYLPASLAYGARGIPGSIGPNETLIFKIHLLNIKSDKHVSRRSRYAG